MNKILETRKYSRLAEFIEQIKTDMEMSKYLYLKNDEYQNKKEYMYNKRLLQLMYNSLKTKPELLNVILYYHKKREFYSLIEPYSKKLNISERTFFRRLSMQLGKFKNDIYKKEDVLYNEYIEKGEK